MGIAANVEGEKKFSEDIKEGIKVANTLGDLSQKLKYIPALKGIKAMLTIANSSNEIIDGIGAQGKDKSDLEKYKGEVSVVANSAEILETLELLPGPLKRVARFFKVLNGYNEVSDGVEKLGGNESSTIRKSIDGVTDIVSGALDIFGDGIGSLITRAGASIAAEAPLEIAEGIALGTAEIPVVGWGIGAAALAVGGVATWYMSKKEQEEKEAHKYDGDKGLNSFANEDPGKVYKPAPSPNFFTSPTKQIALTPNRLNTLAPVIDNTYNKPLPKMPLLTANAKYNQAIIAGLVKLGTSKGKGDFDDFANSMISQAQGTPSLLKYVNKTVSTAGGTLVRNSISDKKARQEILAKQNASLQRQSPSSGTIININTPLIGSFNISAKNMNESYDKVKQEILQVLLEVFNRAAPAH
ncbi:MAG: hypothetical protein P4L41_16370 [Flavipsychrobacter sp.]|nr:hypothetical protein [Flavipsychrobacter sp.]